MCELLLPETPLIKRYCEKGHKCQTLQNSVHYLNEINLECIVDFVLQVKFA